MATLSIDELLEKIPEAYRPQAKEFLTAMVLQSADAVATWIKTIIKGDWQSAYRVAVEAMSTEQKVAELNRWNDAMLESNKAAAVYRKGVKSALNGLVELIISAGLSAIL